MDGSRSFCLHQNRNLGRGGKNCVHETMIPEWMDLVVWGHVVEKEFEQTKSRWSVSNFLRRQFNLFGKVDVAPFSTMTTFI